MSNQAIKIKEKKKKMLAIEMINNTLYLMSFDTAMYAIDHLGHDQGNHMYKRPHHFG
jgi:hypothetical protein